MFQVSRSLWTAAALVAAVACSSGDAGDVEFNDDLRAQLVWMAELDADLRSRVVAAETPNMDDMRELQESEVEQSAKLRELLEEHGWPSVDMVGAAAAEAAWTLLKHGDVELKELGLSLVSQAENPGVAPTDIAIMTDAVLVERGKPQLYGTQFSMVHGRLVQHPVDDGDSVEARRARLGFPPLDEYLEMLQGAHGMMAQPADPHAGMMIVPAQPDTAGDRR
jgi:hypothetical protein